MAKPSALILFAHGARAASWAAPFQRLQTMLREQLPDTPVELAFLELMEPSLSDVVARLVQQGYNQISVIPVFLGQGGHVARDLPAMVDTLRATYPALQLEVSGAVGESPVVLAAIAAYCRSTLAL